MNRNWEFECGKFVKATKCIVKVENGKLNNFSLSTFNFQLKQKAAFTLSEVLITLAVIGVVAAITLPVLSNVYKKVIIKNQIKQAYNLISNAVNSVAADDDLPHRCYYGHDGISTTIAECSEFFDAVVSKLETTKICKKNSFTNGCVPDYKEEDFSAKGVCGGFKASNIKNSVNSAVLKNGIIIFNYSFSANSSYPIIAFDINGFKGPNKPGYDVYSIQLSAKQPNFPIYGLANNNSSPSILNCMEMSNSPLFRNLSEILK